MWRFLSVTYICFTTAYAYKNESFILSDMINILKSDSLEGVSEICHKHLLLLMESFSNGITNVNPWALEMVDSITKFPDGVLLGHFIIPGHFDECVNAGNEEFAGKHCMVKLAFKSEKNLKSLNVYTSLNLDKSIQFTYGICVPSTCNSTDIKAAFEALKLDFIKLDLNETDCSTKEYRPFRTEDWVTVAFILVIFVVAIGSTSYDVFQRIIKKNEKPHELFASFSLYSNGKHLINISQSTAELKCLHGIRFLSMCWVILGHSYFSFLFGAPINITIVPKLLKDKSFIPVSNAYVSVDSFFFLSGLLVCLVFFRDISKKKSYDVPVAFIHRYMRLTPPFAILMLIQATIISRIGNGPFWNTRSDANENNCRESWWMGILYIQNYLKPTSLCLGQAWYLSADMQMFWLSPMILYPILWFPAFAPYFLILLTLVAAFTNFAITYVHGLGPNLISNLSEKTMNQFELEYAPFHTRMAPYIIGIATGYIICGIKAKKIRLNMSKLWAIVGWVAAGFLLGGSLFGIARFMDNESSQAEASFYIAFHRVGWALGLAWLVIACVGGYGSIVNDFLSWNIFQPLGKLSYCNFLVHMTLQNYRINYSRINQYVTHFDVLYSYAGDLLISNIISVPVALLFEFPFIKIDRHFFQKLVIYPLPKPKKNPENENCNEKSEKPVETYKKLEGGTINLTFSTS